MKNKYIIGNFERISFPEFGIDNIVAKIDTGADTGSFHCTNLDEFTKDGIAMISFAPFDHPDIRIETHNFTKKRVKSSNGISEIRYFISTIVNVQGEKLKISISLSDRSQMKYPALIGSKFLREHNFIVDVNLNTV